MNFSLEELAGSAGIVQGKPQKRLPVWLTLPLRILIGIGMIILFIKNPFLFLLLFGMGRGMGGGMRGGFGGGFGGFGGGLSGGGGFSGRW